MSTQNFTRFKLIAETHVPEVYPFAHEYLAPDSVFLEDLMIKRVYSAESLYLHARGNQDRELLINERLSRLCEALLENPEIDPDQYLDVLTAFYLFTREDLTLDKALIEELYFLVSTASMQLLGWIKKFFASSSKMQDIIAPLLEVLAET